PSTMTHLFSSPTMLPPPSPPLFPYTTLFRSIARPKVDRRKATNQLRCRPVVTAVTFMNLDSARTRLVADTAYRHDDLGYKAGPRSEEHTSDSSHGSISYAVFCLKKKNNNKMN